MDGWVCQWVNGGSGEITNDLINLDIIEDLSFVETPPPWVGAWVVRWMGGSVGQWVGLVKSLKIE